MSSKVIEDAITACISRDQEIFQLYETAVPLMITASTNTNSATLSPTTTARTPVLSPTATATATGRHAATNTNTNTPTAATTATSTIESMQSQTQIESSSPQYSINQNINQNQNQKLKSRITTLSKNEWNCLIKYAEKETVSLPIFVNNTKKLETNFMLLKMLGMDLSEYSARTLNIRTNNPGDAGMSMKERRSSSSKMMKSNVGLTESDNINDEDKDKEREREREKEKEKGGDSMEVECSDSDIDRMVISSGNCLIFIQFPNLSIRSNTEPREFQVLESDGTQGLESDLIQGPNIFNVVEVENKIEFEDENIRVRKSRAGSNEMEYTENINENNIENNIDKNIINNDNVIDNIDNNNDRVEDGNDSNIMVDLNNSEENEIVENIDYIVDSVEIDIDGNNIVTNINNIVTNINNNMSNQSYNLNDIENKNDNDNDTVDTEGIKEINISTEYYLKPSFSPKKSKKNQNKIIKQESRSCEIILYSLELPTFKFGDGTLRSTVSKAVSTLNKNNDPESIRKFKQARTNTSMLPVKEELKSFLSISHMENFTTMLCSSMRQGLPVVQGDIHLGLERCGISVYEVDISVMCRKRYLADLALLGSATGTGTGLSGTGTGTGMGHGSGTGLMSGSGSGPWGGTGTNSGMGAGPGPVEGGVAVPGGVSGSPGPGPGVGSLCCAFENTLGRLLVGLEEGNVFVLSNGEYGYDGDHDQDMRSRTMSGCVSNIESGIKRDDNYKLRNDIGGSNDSGGIRSVDTISATQQSQSQSQGESKGVSQSVSGTDNTPRIVDNIDVSLVDRIAFSGSTVHTLSAEREKEKEKDAVGVSYDIDDVTTARSKVSGMNTPPVFLTMSPSTEKITATTTATASNTATANTTTNSKHNTDRDLMGTGTGTIGMDRGLIPKERAIFVRFAVVSRIEKTTGIVPLIGTNVGTLGGNYSMTTGNLSSSSMHHGSSGSLSTIGNLGSSTTQMLGGSGQSVTGNDF